MANWKNRIVCRGPWWPETVVPAVVFGLGWLMGWNPFVTIGAAIAAEVIVQVVKPRRPGRWTE